LGLDVVAGADRALVPDLLYVALGNGLGLIHWASAMIAAHQHDLRTVVETIPDNPLPANTRNDDQCDEV